MENIIKEKVLIIPTVVFNMFDINNIYQSSISELTNKISKVDIEVSNKLLNNILYTQELRETTYDTRKETLYYQLYNDELIIVIDNDELSKNIDKNILRNIIERFIIMSNVNEINGKLLSFIYYKLTNTRKK